ncbi:SCO4848 family membrane protein [Microbacterium sp. 2RAF4]|uniref:SCO4848 family membrane protein n=1 Tax=Microbacterium sp. 2RAF4 TaxID=3232999 RepID=UPI003F98122D
MIPLAIVLFLNAAFNALVWPQFYKRVARDPRARDENGKATAFLKVHAVLIAVALVLALVSLLAGIAALTGAL